MIKHIFCDLDGTLLKDFRLIYPEDVKALQKAQEKGIAVSIATGRLDYEIKMIMDQYNLKGYRISQNGAVVFADNDRLIYEKILRAEDVRIILKALEGQNVIVFFQTAESYFIEKKPFFVSEFEKSQSYITYIEKPDIRKELEKHQFVTISLWTEKHQNKTLKRHLDTVLPKHLESYVSSEYTLDVTGKENSKGKAIKHICDKYRIDDGQVAVIGDSQNDISMFDITEFSFVMQEADDLVKTKARFQVESVKEAVEKILQI